MFAAAAHIAEPRPVVAAAPFDFKLNVTTPELIQGLCDGFSASPSMLQLAVQVEAESSSAAAARLPFAGSPGIDYDDHERLAFHFAARCAALSGMNVPDFDTYVYDEVCFSSASDVFSVLNYRYLAPTPRGQAASSHNVDVDLTYNDQNAGSSYVGFYLPP